MVAMVMAEVEYQQWLIINATVVDIVVETYKIYMGFWKVRPPNSSPSIYQMQANVPVTIGWPSSQEYDMCHAISAETVICVEL